jgi:hypothetical protein
MEALSYWISRLEPVIRAEDRGEIIVVLANRCGVEDEAVYTGTSCVLGIENGEVKLYGVLGRGEKRLLVVDTSETPESKLVQADAIPSIADTRDLTYKEPMSSIDARISETIPVSPVEPSRQHVFFSAQLALLSTDSVEPNSASSLFVHTPWDKTPTSFRAEDLTRLINSSSPKPSSLQIPSPSTSLQVPSPASSLQMPSPASSLQVPSPSPILQSSSTRAAPLPPRPEAPKVRNSSRTRPMEHNPPTLSTKDLANNAPSASMIMSPSQNLTMGESNKSPRERMTISATTSPNQYFATGGSSTSPQLRMALSASTSPSQYIPTGEGSNPPRPRTATSATTSPTKHVLTGEGGNSPQARAATNTSTSPTQNVATGESSNSPRARTATNVTTSPTQNLAQGEASNSPRATYGDRRLK